MIRFFDRAKETGNSRVFYHLINGEYAAALDLLKKSYEGKDIPDDYYFLMGGILRKLNDFEGALQIQKNLFTADKIYPNHIVAQELVANLIALGRDKEAVNFISDFLKKEDDQKLKEILPYLLYTIEDFETAAEHFKKMDNSVMVSYCYYQNALKLGGNDSEFSTYLLKSLKYNNSLRSVRFELAGYYFQNGKNGKGLDLLIEVIYEDLIKSLDDLFYIRDKFKTYADLLQFERLIDKRVNENSSNPFLYIYLSEEALSNGDLEKGKDILVTYSNNYYTPKVILKYYAKLLGDQFLANTFMNEHIYQCDNCKATFINFFSICPSCRYVDTISVH